MKTNLLQSIKISFVIFMTLCSIQIFGQSLSGSTTNVGTKAVKSALSSDTHTIKLVVIGGWNIIRSFEYFDGSAWVSVDDNDPSVSYTNFALHPNGFHESNTAGATAQFTFTGTDIRLKGNTADYCGTAKIYIDNVYQQDVTFYANPGVTDVLIYEKLNLVPAIPVVPPAPHTFKFVVGGGGWCQINKFTYINMEGVEVEVQATNPAITFSNFSLHSNGWLESETIGATVELTFTGTSIKMYGYTNQWAGHGKGYIDNIEVADISFNTIAWGERVLIYGSLNLTTAVETIQNNDFKIYANQADNILHIANAAKNAAISIFSIDGKLVSSLKSTGSEMQIDVAGWNKGVYVVSIRSDKKGMATKLVIR